MDRKDMKAGIEQVLGEAPFFTEQQKQRILSQTKQPKPKKRTGFYLAVTLGILMSVSVFGFVFYHILQQPQQYGFEDSAKRSYESGAELYDGTESQEDSDESILDNQLQPDEATIVELRKLGFEGNLTDIQQEVVARADIIPDAWNEDGSAQFYPIEDIIVLSHEWVYAPVLNSTSAGALLLKYQIKNGQPTDWEIIASYLP